MNHKPINHTWWKKGVGETARGRRGRRWRSIKEEEGGVEGDRGACDNAIEPRKQEDHGRRTSTLPN